ncbi:MAG: AAA family ATPase [Vicinamibacterales bacterium]
MQIESIEVRNYRLFRDARLTNLPRMAVVVGANGSGKTTLFDVFSFLKEALTQNVAQAVARRGGLAELVSRGERGPIGVTVRFRESGGRLATYQLDIANDAGRPVVEREVLKFRRGQFGKPWHFVDFSRGRGSAITNETAYGEEGVVEERKEHGLTTRVF